MSTTYQQTGIRLADTESVRQGMKGNRLSKTLLAVLHGYTFV